jgi:prepilin peptidase CpaA
LPQPSDAIVLTTVAVATSAAAVIDLRTRRIPNALSASLAVVGFGIAAAGLGRVGIGAALLGCALGLAFMLPGHIFGATGAGDVKLFAAAGALLGPAATVQAFLYTAIIGGVVAVVVSIRRRRVGATISATTKLIAGRAGAVAAIESRAADNRFAYAPAIALGVMLAAMTW